MEKCSVNSLFDIERGLYAPAINHFLVVKGCVINAVMRTGMELRMIII